MTTLPVAFSHRSGLGSALAIALASLLILGPGEASRAQTPSEEDDSEFYYRIGGAEPISPPANGTVTSIPIGFSARYRLGNSCASFDPILSMTAQLNQIRNGAENAATEVMNAMTGAVAALPALILQRANPGLYDLMQNALLRIQSQIDLATKSCEQILTESAAGQNPFEEWITLAMGQDWKMAAGVGGLNILTARDTIEGRAGERGVRWVGGRRGGAGQPPIRIMRDTVQAGYNVTLGRAPAAAGPAPVGHTAAITRIWASPEEAAGWAVAVFGDLEVVTCEEGGPGCLPTQGRPGGGLTPQQEKELEGISETLPELVTMTTAPTPEQLRSVSAPGVDLDWPLLQAIKAMPSGARTVAISRLAGEIATARTVEKALYVRRLVLAGRQTPDVAGAEPAQKVLDRKLAEIDREIDNLLFENRVRRELVSETAMAIFSSASDGSARASHTGPKAAPARALLDGSTPRP